MKKNVINENKVILENGKPKICLTEEAMANGGVSVDEAKRLAFQVAMQIVKNNGNSNKRSN